MTNKGSLWSVYALLLLGLLALESDAAQGALDELNLTASQQPIVVELFTSQSCSSCPPADQVLAELAVHDQVIAIGCHVTYWDHLQWKDTLSQAFCTDRQRAYAAAFGNPQVYTPQMVINGEVEFVGSNRSRAAQAITTPDHAVQPLKLTLTSDTVLTLTLPDLAVKAAPQTLWLMQYQNHHSQRMKAGENRGKTVAYTNPAQALKKVGAWSGDAQTLDIPIPKSWPKPNLGGYIVLAQTNGFGAIVAAGKVAF